MIPKLRGGAMKNELTMDSSLSICVSSRLGYSEHQAFLLSGSAYILNCLFSSLKLMLGRLMQYVYWVDIFSMPFPISLG